MRIHWCWEWESIQATRVLIQVEQIPHFFLENTRKSLIYQSLLMLTTKTRWVWMWLTSIKPILISRCNWYLLFYWILETALIKSPIIYWDLPAIKESTVEHFDFRLSIVHDIMQAGSLPRMKSPSCFLASQKITRLPQATPMLHEPDQAELQLSWYQGTQPVGYKVPNYLVCISSLSPAL